ncbi:D-alanyl-D-alanine carboxypeptidase/D-alanyl-D-alanine-endopeptidase [Parasutterella sp.]|uniref:D-alanyl-D-alanine carboxypeptidase/D-alanyl-D-alanine endopeptidase n=1 Tax=Parasutterella sp. TaxID=2049037 RepID=UPI003992AB5E
MVKFSVVALSFFIFFSPAGQAASQKSAPSLPAPIQKALNSCKVPKGDFSLSVIPLTDKGTVLKFNSAAPRVPASSAKVITSAAALQLLGPAKVWTTRFISAEEPDKNGVLSGDLYLVGHGAPSMTIERFWLLVDNLRARGVKEIKGNIIADRSHFDVAPHDPFAFDGEGNRPYNLGPDALMVNSRSFFIKIRPDKEAGVAYLYPEPRIAGVKLPESIPLSKEGRRMEKTNQSDFSNPLKPAFKGKFPLKCGPKDYFYTSLSADQYLQVVFADMWKKAGGTWKGKVVQGKLPDDSDDYKVLASSYSEPLTKLVYNMNKYSDNIIARQLFLALAKTQKDEPKNLEGARAAVYEWAASLKIPPSSLKIDNGSGLSRTTAISTDAFVTVLKHMWNAPQMPEFVSSLPISGVDGTMRKRHVAQGSAHVKTGYIQNVRSIAGYVQTKSGERYAVAAIVNGPSAVNSIPVMDAVISWVYGR